MDTRSRTTPNLQRGVVATFALLLPAIALFLAGEPTGAQENFRWKKPSGEQKTIKHNGVERIYRIHVPKSLVHSDKPRPVVFVLHGGGMGADRISTLGFSELADREKFIVVYPQAIDKHWNDGRKGKLIVEKAGDADDVGFVIALLEKVKKEYAVDATRIYATGFSNGGMMSHRLGIEKPDVFAAIAPGIGGITKPLGSDEKFKPEGSMSILIIQGTEDPFVPYDGGRITPEIVKRGGVFSRRRDHGEIISTGRTLELWKKANGIRGEPKVTKLPDKDPGDGCTLERSEWPAGRNGSRMVLVRMIGAGHTVPGAAQYLPAGIVGRTCRDANAVEMIWGFFKTVPPRTGRKAKTRGN